MKLLCNKCGCHFKDDFDVALRCGYWKNIGLSKISRANKRILWDWIFSMPQDKIHLEDGVQLRFALQGTYTGRKENVFVDKVGGYKDWSEKDRQDFQRDYTKFVSDISPEAYEDLMLNIFVNNIWLKEDEE